MKNYSDPSRTSAITPLIQTVSFLAPVGIVLVTIGSIPFLGLGVVALAGAIYLLNYLVWNRFTFAVTTAMSHEPELIVNSGIFIRTTKTLRIARLQAVDIHRPLVARIFGYATLQVEVAGTGDSRAILRYLSMADAQDLRTFILRLAGNSPSIEPTSEEFPHWDVPNSRLVASLALTTSTYVIAAGALFSVIIAIANGFGGLAALTITVFGAGISVVAGFTQFFNFRLCKDTRGITISHGLFSTSSYTISPIRLQAIDISQPLAWRFLGWHRISINVAGIDTNTGTKGPRVLIPVIHHTHLNTLLTTLVPEWEINLDSDWLPAASNARWRYPLQHTYIGSYISETVCAARTGWLTRHMKFAPHARIQSIRLTQGPFQRSLDLITAHCDSVPGPIKIAIPGFQSHRALTMLRTESVHINRAINDGRSENWGVPH